MRVVAIDHVVLGASDPAASLDFYQRVLGLPAERLEAFLSGQAGFASVRAGDALIDLRPQPTDGPTVDHVCLRIDATIEDIVAHLLAAGAKPLGPPSRRFGATGEGLSVYVRDPSGNVLELKSDRRAG